jgi:hypothetical protein
MRSLAILDPLLSVRDSVVTSHWVIERKAVILPSEIETLKRRRDRIYRWITFPNETQKAQIHQNRKAWQSLVDEVESAERGKRVIARPRTLNQEVYDGLCRSDFRRYGGAARFCTELEQEEERLEAEAERVMSNKRTAFNAECYDIMNFLERRKSDAMANRPEAELDLRYLLHGKHTKSTDSPLIQLSDF